MEIINNEWNLIDENLKILTKEYNPISLKYLLDLGFDEDLTTNEELTYQDLYDALNAVLLAIIETALIEDRFEIIMLANKVHNKQSSIMKKEIDKEPDNDQKEENFWCLEFSKQYFQETQKLQTYKYTTK